MIIYVVRIISFDKWNQPDYEDLFFSSKEKANEAMESYELPNKDVVTIQIHEVTLDTNESKMIYSQTF